MLARIHCFAVLAIPALLGATALAAPTGNMPVLQPEGRRVLIVLVDGLPASVLHEGIAMGAMPRLTTLLDGRPSAELAMFSTFPTATSPAVQEMVSGRFCTLAELPTPAAVHAFDRERRRVVRTVTSPEAWLWPVPNLFDAATAAGLTVTSVFEAAWDGPQTLIQTRKAIVADAALDLVGVSEFNGDTAPVGEFIEQLRREEPPELAFVVLDSFDLAGHFHGPRSVEAWEALAGVDALLGHLLDVLAETPGPRGTPLLEDTTLIFTADHGMVESGRFIDLVSFFGADGHVAYDASTMGHVLFRERMGELWTRWPDAILVSGGSNVTQVYLRRTGGSWASDAGPAGPMERSRAATRPDVIETAARIAALEGVAQVLRQQDSHRVEVRNRDGVAHAQRGSDGRVAYVVPAAATGDPFGYLADPAVAPWVCREGAVGDRCYLDREAWLLHTSSARYPGAPPLALQGFHQERFTGDLIVTALPGYTFLSGQKGDHGDLEREAMLVPLLMNGPGVQDGCVATAPMRLVDVAPTAAVLLGARRDDPALLELDGRPSACVQGP